MSQWERGHRGRSAAPTIPTTQPAASPVPAAAASPKLSAGGPPALGADGPLEALRAAIGKVIVGQDELIARLLTALLCDGHCLIEGVPGLAKSLTVSTLAASLRASYVRVQFTPDLLPADLMGSEIYNAAESRFEVRRGPIFTNVLLADEVNRAPAKVQSALLESMQERQVSIGGQTFALPQPFLVLATQNPIEQEGTYPLPEAELDRFMLKVVVDYPSEREEREVLDRQLAGAQEEPRPVMDAEALLDLRQQVSAVRMELRLRDYVVQLARATRSPARVDRGLAGYVAHGASPRATAALALAARAHAFLAGRDYTTPDDVKALAHDVLRHRVVLTYEAEADAVTADAVLERLLLGVPLP